jgi:hypothetical protein
MPTTAHLLSRYGPITFTLETQEDISTFLRVLYQLRMTLPMYWSR